ncbi:Rieske (2Fe-2S) protein [Streptomyces sp. MS06]|uniref:Rieske (2Fe-2S) protein n=1 Tax=Streptomyces sp. MS06 TaxID=3385974 RepID=UPI00399F2E61
MSGRPAPSRRLLLKSAAATPAAGLALTACSGETGPAAPTAPVDLGAASEVPEGGAHLYRDHNVVVSRSGDTYTAHSTICTHAGCAINKLQGTTLICPCHGSEFDARTGDVLRDPATEPLQKLSVQAKNGRIVAGPAD